MTDDELDRFFDVPFTFSVNCCSGLVERCECWRCRRSRGEPVTEETEAMAKRLSDDAKREIRASTMRILRRRKP